MTTQTKFRCFTFCALLAVVGVAVMAQGIISHPARKKPLRVTSRPTPKPAPPKVVMYEHAGYQGESLVVETNLPALPPPFNNTQGSLNGTASSLKVNFSGWVVFYEGRDFNDGKDQLWIQGPTTISDLSKLHRPHGNNHWGDRILSVSFPGHPPQNAKSNYTIISRSTTIR